MDFIRKQRALARMGVRATGLEAFEHYRSVASYARSANMRPANDNPRPPRRLRLRWSVFVSLIAIAFVAVILVSAY